MGQSHLVPSGAGFNARWKQLYAAAVLELDDTKLADRITKARAAMQEAADGSPSNEERRTLGDGFRILQVLEDMAAKENRAA